MKKLPLLITGFIMAFLMDGVVNSELMAQTESLSPELVSNVAAHNSKKGNRVSLANVLTKLEQHFKTTFLFKDEVVQDKWVRTDKIQLGENTGGQLANILDGLGLTYHQLDEQTYVLLPKKRNVQEQISGTVTDAQSGETLPGVNILVKGTSTGASTDANGHYEFTLESLQDTLVVSFVGYKTQQVPIKGRTKINVALQKQAITGEEMVVVGYGEQKATNISAAQESISSESFERQPVTNASEALEGKVSGVRIRRTNAQPGSGFKMRIRGVNSINGNNDALIVVDGMQGASMSDLDPDDIASIDVLKDASATAIYGSRGANGVVLITTKSGTSEKMRINIKSTVGFQTVTKRMSVLNAGEFAQTINDARIATGGTAPFTQEEIAEYKENGGTDWQDLVLRDGVPKQHYNLSLSQSKGGIDYYVSGGFVQNNGTLYDQKYKRYNLTSKIGFQFTDRLKANLNIRGFKSTRNGQGLADLTDAVIMSPFVSPFKDADGNLALTGKYASLTRNPYVKAKLTNVNDKNYRIEASGSVDYQIIDGLSVNIFGSLLKNNTNNGFYRSIAFTGKGSGNVVNNNSISFQNTNRITYQKEFNKDNELKVDLIGEQQYFNYEGNTISASNFSTDATGYKNLSIADVINPSQNYYNRKLLSLLGRVHYIWRDKYIITATSRTDGSSKFRKGHRFGTFPSVSVGWKMGSENFMKNSSFFDQFKWRISYGETGSQAISALATRAKLVSGTSVSWDINDSGSRQVGIAPTSNLNNPLLAWETTDQTNIGVDISMLHSKLRFSADVYKKKTHDLLLNVGLPNYTGASEIVRNLGEMENKGLELEVGATPVNSGDWNVDFNLNFSLNRNKVLALGENELIETGGRPSQTGGVSPTVLKIGEPISSFQGYVFEGVYQEDEADLADKFGKQPGDAKYKDINGDGAISGEDITLIGSPLPDYIFGFNSTVSYKNFDLNLVINGSKGGQVYNIVYGGMFGLGGQNRDAVTKAILDRWSPDNPSSTIPTFTTTSATKVGSSQFVQDASWVRFKNISLGYNLPSQIFNNTQISSLKLYGSIQNAISFYSKDFVGFDPNLESSTGDRSMGIYNGFSSYPLPRIITFGLNLKF